MSLEKNKLIKWLVVFHVVSIWLLSALPAYPYQDSNQSLRFEKISLEKGLSQASILCLLQDSQGFLWLGTYDGLNRYDGYHFLVFKSQPGQAGSLSDNQVRALYEDRFGLLWIGTSGGGLNRYDRKTGRFDYYQHHPKNLSTISSNDVRAIMEDHRGSIWVGTSNGLNHFDRSNGTFTSYHHHPADPSSIVSNQILTIYEDPYKTLWLGTENGLSRFHRESGTFTNFEVAPGEEKRSNKIGGKYVRALYYEEPGYLWIGTERRGLSRLEIATGIIDHYLLSYNVHCIFVDSRNNFWLGTNKGLARRVTTENNGAEVSYDFVFHTHNPFDPESLSHDEIFSIIEDKSGILWVGTNGSGLCKLNPAVQAFGFWRQVPGSPRSLSGNHVTAVCESPEGVLWVGTYKNGLNRIDRHIGRVTHIPLTRFLPDSPPGNSVRRLMIDHEGYLWIGTGETGLIKTQQDGANFMVYRHDENDDTSLSQDNIYFVFEDSRRNIWVGTSKKGLNKLDRSTGRFTRYTADAHDPDSISHNRVRYIMEDRDGVLWMGTNGGLNRFDPKKETFSHWAYSADNPEGISNNRVTPIMQDDRGLFWVGTDMGLNLFDPQTGIFKHYTKEDGLENDAIQAMEMDHRGRIWMSTFKGISMLDPASGEVRNYNVRDGLQGIEFWINSNFKSSRGEMFFGGMNGMNSFFPEDIKINNHQPQVVVTDFKIMNEFRPIPIATQDGPDIVMSYQDLFFSFGFAALDYAAPEENTYKYMLEGFDRKWVDIGNTRTAVYTNIDPGAYVFKVKAANNDGVWNEQPAELSILITPPFWRTPWFLTLLAFTVTALLIGIYTFRVQSLKAQSERLETLVRERTMALEDEIEERKQIETALQEARDYLEERVIERTERLRRLTSELSLTEERERRAIATNLHDNICQNLALSEIKLRQMKDNGSPLELDSLFMEVRELINQMSVDVRSLMVELSPPILYDIGLIAALNWLTEQFEEKYQVRMHFVCENGMLKMEDDLKILLFRSVRELLFNIVKHAQAKTASVKVESDEFNITIEVRDDGVGFDVTKFDERSDNVYSFGLFSVRERLLAIGGQLDLQSQIGQGVKANITAPVKYASREIAV